MPLHDKEVHPLPTRVLLFDLGGVLIDIDFDRVYRHWATFSPKPFESIREGFVFEEHYHRYERGETGDAEYFDHVRRTLSLTASDEEILEGWNAVFVGLNHEVLTLARNASRHLPSYAFTNTSRSHQVAWSDRYPDIHLTFRQVFSSAEMGLRKPERPAFEAVVDGIGVDPSSILFFDDMPQNVEGARVAGIQAVLVRSPADVRGSLAALGLA
jgi:putative hydrolase of the HAD superfamily